MEQTFRQSMNWLHTWSGVVVGGLLFAVFWTGTLVVFNKEIDRWMAPATRLAMPDAPISLDAQRATYPEAVAARAPNWNLILPNDRAPAVRTAWRGPTGIVSRYSDPRTGNELADDGTLAGTGFLYPFHYQLNIRFMNLGVWLVGIAGMAMLVLCVSGVIVHRKIFVDFFTFRPNRKVQRAVLDLHNVAGVLGLPFHFVIALSGVIVFFVHYFPSGWTAVYGSGNLRAFTQETLQSFSRPKLNKPGELASLDAMADLVRRRWPKQELRTLTVVHPGDAAAYVQITLWEPDNVTHAVGAAFFDGTTGALLGWRLELEPVIRFILGLHVVQFHHWALRWLYFALGLAGCALIGTGYLFWLESRRKQHAMLGLSGVRVVEVIAMGSVTGIVVATLAFFVVNRALPLGVADRADIEVWTFYGVWIATLLHAALRPGRKAWREQCWTISAMAVLAVVLNAATTGDHLVRSLAYPHLWSVAGMDLMLLLSAVVAIVAALKLGASERRIAASSSVEETAQNA